MSNSSNDLALALLATLEAHAKKKGKTSVVKGVLGRLREAGADEVLLGQVEALADGKPLAAAARKNGSKANGNAKAKRADGAPSAA